MFCRPSTCVFMFSTAGQHPSDYFTLQMFKRILYYSAIISPPVFGHTPSIFWSVDVSDVNFVNF